MIALNPQDAVNIMNGQFLRQWTDGRVLALIGYDTAIFWQGVTLNKKPDATKYFVRVSHQTVLETQATLSGNVETPGQKRFNIQGLTIIQLFCPTSDAKCAETGLALATIARNAFRGALAHSGNDVVWFKRARINQLPLENDLYRLNVVAEHEYDEIG